MRCESHVSATNHLQPSELLGSHFPKSFICHTSEKHARNPFPCHTSIFIGLKVVCLPHIRKTNRVPARSRPAPRSRLQSSSTANRKRSTAYLACQAEQFGQKAGSMWNFLAEILRSGL